jgi:hypothetical protein
MNLTKGKISKLYSKKKQSLKRNKNKRGHSGKSKTFRKNKRVNLARKSLKRLHFKENKGGGVNDNELPKETTDNKQVDDYVANSASKAEPSPVIGSPFKSPPETSTEPSFESPEFSDTPPSESSSAPDVTPSAVEETPPTVEETPPTVEETPPTVEETTPAVEETPPASDVTPPASDVTPPASDVTPPASDVTPPASDVTPPASDVTPPAPEETPLAPDVTPPSPSVDPTVDEPTASPTVVESTNNDDPELASAINNVVSLITEKVTKKVSEEVNANSVDAAQNGFKEIDETARIMGSSGGGKKPKPNKSRKFKLMRENKTRRTA